MEDEEKIEDKNGIRKESIPYPWDEVSYYILRYISCEGRLSVVYGYQFRLLHGFSLEKSYLLIEDLVCPTSCCNQ